MANLLFDTPWWLPTLLAGCGIVLFWNGNRRQETRLRNVGLLLTVVAVAVMGVSYLVDTDLEKCVKQSKELVYAVEQQDWNKMKVILDPGVAVSVLGAGPFYNGANQTILGAQDAVGRWGFTNARVLSTTANQTDTIITVAMSLLTEHDKSPVPTINTAWEFEWQQTGDTWALVRITNLQIGNLKGDAAGAQFPRPR